MPSSHLMPRQNSTLPGAPLLAAARLLRDPKIRIDQPPLHQTDPTRPYWDAQAALHHRESRPS